MTASRKPSRHHHFVPARHISRWASVKHPSSYRLDKVWWLHKLGTKPVLQTVEKVFVENDHHTIRMEDGTDSDWMDSRWMATVEGEIPKAVNVLVDGSRPLYTIGDSDRDGIALFINLLWYTIPKYIRKAMATTPGIASEAALFAGWKLAHPAPPPDPDALRQFTLARAVDSVFQRTKPVTDSAWQLFRVDPSSTANLILADDPVLEFQVSGRDGKKYTVLALALDPRVLLVVYPFRRPNEADGVLDEGDVRAANQQWWAQAENAVVGLTPSDLDPAVLGGSPTVPRAFHAVLEARAPQLFAP
jgi:hypothetical protein